LVYEREQSEHAYEKTAIKVFKGNNHIGYIKNIHNHPFLKSKNPLKLTVKSIDQNGMIRQIFVLVEYSRF